jgi:hypothetical protein
MIDKTIDPMKIEEIAYKVGDNEHLLEILLEMLDRLGEHPNLYPDVEIDSELKRVLPQMLALTLAILNGTTSNYDDLMKLVNKRKEGD